MSAAVMEKVLWEIGLDPKRAAQFKADADQYLAAYDLAPEETQMLKGLDVRLMQARGVSPMLTMRAWSALKGRDQMPEYLRKLQA